MRLAAPKLRRRVAAFNEPPSYGPLDFALRASSVQAETQRHRESAMGLMSLLSAALYYHPAITVAATSVFVVIIYAATRIRRSS